MYAWLQAATVDPATDGTNATVDPPTDGTNATVIPPVVRTRRDTGESREVLYVAGERMSEHQFSEVWREDQSKVHSLSLALSLNTFCEHITSLQLDHKQ